MLRKGNFTVNPVVLQYKQQKIMARFAPRFLEEASSFLLGRARLEKKKKKRKSLSLPINSPREALVPGIALESPRGKKPTD